jgi:flagellar hook-length control protein FliK
MNLSALPELLLSWVKNQGVALLQGDKAQASPFQTGQQYEGKVVDNLASGRHLVKVGAQMLDMNLPAKAQPGDSVRLTFLNAGPRPTFLLNQTPITPVQQVQISNTAQQVNALLRLAQTPVASAQSASVPTAASSAKAPATSVASAAKLISLASPSASPASTAAANASAKVAAATTTNVPLINAAPEGLASKLTASSGALSAAVSTTVPAAVRGATVTSETVKVGSQPLAAASSGATAAPVTGVASRPIVANVLMLQSFNSNLQPMTATLTGPNTGLLGQAVDAPRASIAASTTLSANTLVELPSPSRHMLPVRLSQTVSESGLFYESHLAKWSRGSLSLEAILREPQARLGQDNTLAPRLADLDGMPEAVARMAGRQLQMLEGAPFLWQGLAWPGQTMEWMVREEYGGEGQPEGGESAAEWSTELNLTLPRLGQVLAQLGLAGDQLQLRLHADTAATRDKLNAALPLLIKGLEANGLRAIDPQVEALEGEHGQA